MKKRPIQFKKRKNLGGQVLDSRFNELNFLDDQPKLQPQEKNITGVVPAKLIPPAK